MRGPIRDDVELRTTPGFVYTSVSVPYAHLFAYGIFARISYTTQLRIGYGPYSSKSSIDDDRKSIKQSIKLDFNKYVFI